MERKPDLRQQTPHDFLQAVSDCHQALTRVLEIANLGYLSPNDAESQEEKRKPLPKGSAPPSIDKSTPPFVPQGATITCTRCSHQWMPYVRQPKKCPHCRTPWWFPPRWRWKSKTNPG